MYTTMTQRWCDQVFDDVHYTSALPYQPIVGLKAHMSPICGYPACHGEQAVYSYKILNKKALM
jgi:hypothetical protein